MEEQKAKETISPEQLRKVQQQYAAAQEKSQCWTEAAEKDIVRFLKCIFQNCDSGYLELRFNRGKSTFSEFYPLSEIDSVPKLVESKLGAYNIWYGGSLKQEKKYDPNESGKKEDTYLIAILWLDIDDLTPEKEALINGFPLTPTAVVQTSSEKKKQYLWVLKEPLGPEAISRVETTLRKMIQRFGGDPGCKDVSHVLRLPGCPNIKYESRPIAHILEINPDYQYELEDFEAIFSEIRESLTSETSMEKKNPDGWWEDLLIKKKPGQRHGALAQLAGRYIQKDLSREEILPLLLSFNARYVPPLEAEQVEEILDSIIKGHERRHPNEKRNSLSALEILNALPTFNDLDPDKEVEWLIEGFIPAKAITSIFGKTGIGKSHVIYLMGKCVLEGTDFIGLKTKQRPVYYLDYENPEDVRCHIRKVCGGSAVKMWALDSPVGPPPKLDRSGWEILKELPPGLIIVDSFRACQLKDTTKDVDAAVIMDKLKQLWACGHTIIIILHTLKDQDRKWKSNQVVEDESDNFLALYQVREIGSEEEVEGEDDMNAPKLLYFGNMKNLKSRFGKQKVYLRYNPNVNDPDCGIKKAESLVKQDLHEIQSRFWKWKQEKEKELGRELKISDCPNKEEFEALIKKWGFKGTRNLIKRGKKQELWSEDVDETRKGRPHYFFPKLISS